MKPNPTNSEVLQPLQELLSSPETKFSFEQGLKFFRKHQNPIDK